MRLSRPDAPQDLESAADRNRAARRSSRPLLDPHGIYGTRTAARQRTARRRQAVQSLTIFAIAVAVVLSALWWVKGQRVPRLARLERFDMGTRVAAAPARGNIEAADLLVVPREDGSLLLRWDQRQTISNTVWRGDFPLRAAPLVADNRIYAAMENGAVLALDAALLKAPKVRWKWFAASAVSTDLVLFVPPAPAVAAGIAPAPVAIKPLLIVADDDGTVTALRADTGGQAWVQHLRAPAGTAMALQSAGALSGRVWVPLGAGTSGFEGGVACLEAASGRVLWKLETGAPVLPSPAIDVTRERLYCAGDDGSVWALDARTGRKIWRITVSSASPADGAIVLRGAVALTGGGASIIVGGNDGIWRCLSAAAGSEVWRFQMSTSVCISATPFQNESGSELLACAGDGDLLWILDAASGAPVRRVATSGIPRGAPMIRGTSPTNRTLETVSRDGWLERFALPR